MTVLRFILDENIPKKLFKTLKEMGHDVVRASAASSDQSISEIARKDKRIIITIDKDFTVKSVYPPREFDIIHIHPPNKEAVIEAVRELLENCPAERIKNLIILEKEGPVFVRE